MLKNIGIILNPYVKNPFIKMRMIEAVKNLSAYFDGDLFLTSDAYKFVKEVDSGKLKPLEDEDAVVKASQAIACVGGDGSILHTVHLMHSMECSDKIIYTINTSEVGKLTKFNYQEESIQMMLGRKGAALVEERKPMYTCHAGNKNTLMFFNEVFISSEKLTTFTIARESQALSFKASGLIISTPQGSTGMTNSYGGPTISPSLHDKELAVITPVGVLREKVAPMICESDVQIFAEGNHRFITDGGKERTLYENKTSAMLFHSHFCRFMSYQKYIHLN